MFTTSYPELTRSRKPGSAFFVCFYNPKKLSKIRSGMHPGSGSGFFPVPASGAKIYRIPDPDPQHRFILKVKHMPYLKKKIFFTCIFDDGNIPERYRFLLYIFHSDKKNKKYSSAVVKSRDALYKSNLYGRSGTYHSIVTNVIVYHTFVSEWIYQSEATRRCATTFGQEFRQTKGRPD